MALEIPQALRRGELESAVAPMRTYWTAREARVARDRVQLARIKLILEAMRYGGDLAGPGLSFTLRYNATTGRMDKIPN